MALHGITMTFAAIATYCWLGQRYPRSILPHEQLGAALLVAFFMPVL